MKRLVHNLIVTLSFIALPMLTLAAGSVHAKAKHVQKEYYNSKGERLEAIEAMKQALEGEQVVQCQPVELKQSKSGNSIALHTKKSEL